MTDTPSVVTREISWLKSHVITLGLSAALVFGSVYGIEYLVERHDQAKNALYQQIYATQGAQIKALSDKFDQSEAQRKADNDASKQIIGQFAAQIAARDASLQKQQQINATLTATAAAERLSQQTKGNVTAQGDSVVADLPTARTIVSGLDALQTSQADLSDTQKQLTAQTAISTNLQATVADQKQINDALTTQLVNGQKACQAQVAEVKAKARKNYLKVFLGGVVAGLALHFIGG